MGIHDKRRGPRGRRPLLLLVLAGCLLGLPSCAFIWPTSPKKPPLPDTTKPPAGETFRSDDYILYVLQGGETPGILARYFLGDPGKAWIIEEANEGVPFKKGRLIVIPLRDENRAGLRANGYQAVPILTYHHFAKTCVSSFCMPTSVFEQQLRYLKENHFRVISMRHLLGFMQYRHGLPKKSVVIAIDDGNRSAHTIAFPILRKYGFAATLFIYTNFVGISRGAITWSQLREMKAAGFEIGSHTKSHSDLTKQMEGEDDETYLARVRKELLDSKQILDQKLRQDTVYLAFPYGRYNERILALADQVGYKMGFSVKRGGNPFFADPLRLKRDQILKRDMETFISRLKTFYRFPLR